MRIRLKIIKGKGRGKSVLGHATANAILPLDDKSFKNYPKSRMSEGSWFVKAQVNIQTKEFKTLDAVCGVSKKANDLIFETHILNFDGDLYGQEIIIIPVYKIRESLIFKSLKESKEQLIKDIEFAKNYKSCDTCKFCVYQDHGYSNYTVEGTTISCLVSKFEEYDDSYGDNFSLGIATTCDHYNEGEHWILDVDGESGSIDEEWLRIELRDFKIKNIIEK
jgi:hypothetical protein